MTKAAEASAAMDIGTACADLATGYGSQASIGVLKRQLLRRRIILLRMLVVDAVSRYPDDAAKAGIEDAYHRLTAAERSNPDVLDAVLLYPRTGAWLAHVLGRFDGAAPGRHSVALDVDEVPLWVDLSYAGWIAASVEVRIGGEGTVRLVSRGGAVLLPGIGSARVGPESRHLPCDLTWSADGGLRFETGSATVVVAARDAVDDPRWLPVRRLSAPTGNDEAVSVEDIDPFRRDANAQNRFPRLTSEQAASWQDAYSSAYELLDTDFRRYHLSMRAGLREIVPLTGEPQLHISSQSAASAFGSVHTSAPADRCELALTLIHEFQHAKLDLLAGETELVERDETCRFYAPWRNDPRPILGLLHGIYAHSAVVDFWRVHRHSECHRAYGDVEFALWRIQVDVAMSQALTSGLLTTEGRALLENLTATVSTWCSEEVSEQARHAADESATAHRVYWRVRNLRPPMGTTDAREAHSSEMSDMPTPTVVDQSDIPGAYKHFPLWYYAKIRKVPGDDVASAADIAYLSGNLTRAVTHYSKTLQADPVHPQSWAGLALVLPRLYPDVDTSLLHNHPETLAHLYRTAHAHGSTDPVEFVMKMSPRAG